MDNLAIIAAAFDAYRSGDRDAAWPMYAEDFRFTSPQDDHIDKGAFFERCFPTASRVTRQDTVHLVDADGESSFIMYEYTLGPDTESPGAVHRNVELITVVDGLITEVQVFFGGRVSRAPEFGARPPKTRADLGRAPVDEVAARTTWER